MSERADVLELIDRAPNGLRTLHAMFHSWTHRDRLIQVQRRLHPQMPHNFITIGGAAAQDLPEIDLVEEVWLKWPDRWHRESTERIDIYNGTTRWYGSRESVIVSDNPDPMMGEMMLSVSVAPGALLGDWQLGQPELTELAGRPAWQIEAIERPELKWRNNAGPGPGYLGFGGYDHRLFIDVATGVALRHEGLIDGEICTVLELLDVEIDVPIAPERFEFAATNETRVQSQSEQLLSAMANMGIDVSSIDPTDEQAVQAAARNMFREAHKSGVFRQARKDQHVPTGPPPDDEDGARADIAHAVENMREVADDGTMLVNVQAGADLIPRLGLVGHQMPGLAPEDVWLGLDDVLFLSSDRAVIWFSLHLREPATDADDNAALMAPVVPPFLEDQEGYAVRIGGRWVVEHATFAEFMSHGGSLAVEAEPPSDPSDPSGTD